MAGAATLQELGRAVTIFDEGVTLTSNVSSMNFTGAGVTGTNIGSAVTESISGGSSGGTVVIGETVTFSGTTGTLAHSALVGSLKFYRNGIRQKEMTDFSISGAAVTLVGAAQVGELFLADYEY